jgi:hypothetical protein
MVCAFCGSTTAKISFRSALADGGLVRIPTCAVDETWVEETFSRPLSMRQLISMAKAVQ